MLDGESGDLRMADSNSRIAWHRAQLKKNREALKSLEVARFAGSHDRRGDTAKAMAELGRKITESEKCIAAYERATKRPLGTDFGSLTNVSWSHWNSRTHGERS
jgi:hypothetical protein